MKKYVALLALTALFSCSKTDVPEEEYARAKNKTMYLSEVYVDGKITKQHFYDDKKPIKTRFYYNSSYSDLIYDYNPTNRSVVYDQSGYVQTYYYDKENRPIRQDNYGFIIIDYTYEKDRIVRILSTTNANGKVRATDNFKFVYSGNRLNRINNKVTSYPDNQPSYSQLTVYETNWADAYNYSYYNTKLPNNVYKYQYSRQVKSPEYNFIITPTGLLNPNKLPSNLIRNDGIIFTNPSHGMLLINRQDPTVRRYLENIIANNDDLPLSYDQVTEETIDGVVKTTRQKYEYRYVRL